MTQMDENTAKPRAENRMNSRRTTASQYVFCMNAIGPTILLVVIYTPESPGDHGACGKVTVGIVKGITCARGLKGEKRNDECKDLC